MKTKKISNEPKDWFKIFSYSVVLTLSFCFYSNNMNHFLGFISISFISCFIGFLLFCLINLFIKDDNN